MKRRTFLSACLLIAALLLTLTSCTGTQTPVGAPTPPPSSSPSAPVDTPEATAAAKAEANYDGQLIYDHSMELTYAKYFAVDYYKGGYKMISVADGSRLLIVPEGMSVPEQADESVIVLKQPVSNILVSSTPTTSLFAAIDALDAISLTTYDVDSWYIEDVKEQMRAGKMTYIGTYKEPDYEKITAADTKFAIFSAMLTEDVAAQLDTLGVQVMLDQAAEEDHPLARVEWVKLYGAMFNKEEEADAAFEAQKKLVDDIAAQEETGKSVAIFYITSKGALYTRNSDDYMAKMVKLAGGQYVLDGKIGVGETGTAKMEFEAFYDGAKDADAILYIWSLGGKPETLEQLLERGEILSEMKAVKEGNVWCTTPDFFQISSTLGDMISDIRLMLRSDGTQDAFSYLFKLK